MCAPHELPTLSISNLTMNVSEHSVLTMDSLLTGDDDCEENSSILSFEHDRCENDFVVSFAAEDDQDESSEVCVLASSFSECEQGNAAYVSLENILNNRKPTKQQQQMYQQEKGHCTAVIGRQRHLYYEYQMMPKSSALSHTQRLPFVVTAVYLFTQFNVSLYLSESIQLTSYQWFLVNCIVASFLCASEQYRKVMSQMHVQSSIPLSMTEIFTAITLVLLILQLRSAALVLLVGGVFYMALATGIARVYLLTFGNGKMGNDEDDDDDDDTNNEPFRLL